MTLISNFFNQGWVGSVIGIIGVLIAIYTYKKAKIGPRLVYQMESLKIIGKNDVTPEEITIFYKGLKVPRIIKTTIIIWNSGTKTIDGQNIVKNDQLRLEFSKNEEIIGASILKRTKDVNQFEITNSNEEKNILNMNFEYLDPQDGVSIEILHTDLGRYPKLRGSIKGIPKGVINWGGKSSDGKTNPENFSTFMIKMFKSKIILWFMLVMGVGLTAFSLIVPHYFPGLAKSLIESNNKSQYSIFNGFAFAGILYSIVPIFDFWTNRKRYPKLLALEKLESEVVKLSLFGSHKRGRDLKK